jgi:hypothetical protein
MTCKGERHWLRLRFRGEEGLVIIGHAGWELSGSSVTFTFVAGVLSAVHAPLTSPGDALIQLNAPLTQL